MGLTPIIFICNMSKKDFLVKILKPILVLALIGAIYFFIFIKTGVGIPCLFRKITGYMCPGCGMTHAIASILTGDIKAAWNYNELSITIVPIVCLYLLYRVVREKKQVKVEFYLWEYFLLAVLFVIVVAYGFMRNIRIL